MTCTGIACHSSPALLPGPSTRPGGLRKLKTKPNLNKAMTKGHNQDKNKSQQPEAKKKGGQEGNRSLGDQQKDKSPNQGRNKGDQSGGTKGPNAI